MKLKTLVIPTLLIGLAAPVKAVRMHTNIEDLKPTTSRVTSLSHSFEEVNYLSSAEKLLSRSFLSERQLNILEPTCGGEAGCSNNDPDPDPDPDPYRDIVNQSPCSI